MTDEFKLEHERVLYRLLLTEANECGLTKSFGGHANLKAEVERVASAECEDKDGELDWSEACCDALEELVDAKKAKDKADRHTEAMVASVSRCSRAYARNMYR